MRRVISIFEIAAVALMALAAGLVIGIAVAIYAYADTPPQQPGGTADQWFAKAQGDMNALTSTLNLGLTAINSDMAHLEAQLAAEDAQVRALQAQVKALEAAKGAPKKAAPPAATAP